MIDDESVERLHAEFVRRANATEDVDAANAWQEAAQLLSTAATPRRIVFGLAPVPAVDRCVTPIDADPANVAEVRAARSERRCPDDGRCWHECTAVGRCWRVDTCGPLSGVFPEDRWPSEVVEAEHAKPSIGSL